MIIVTGAAGFIGSVMLARLNAEGVDDIIAVDVCGTDERWKNLANKRIQDIVHRDDFLEKLEKGAFRKIDAVIHMGACSSTKERDVDFLLRNNYGYSKTLASYCVANRIRFIYASSAATYGDGSRGFRDDDSALPQLRPLNPYGYSKQLFDLWAARQGFLDKICGIKFFNVFGPNEAHKVGMWSGVYHAYQQVRSSGRVKLFRSHRAEYKDGEQKRDFVYVRDCADVMWWLLNNAQVNGVLNLGSGRAATWIELVTPVFEALGLPVAIDFIDMPEELRSQYQYFTQAEMGRLKQAGYTKEFTPLSVAVKEYVTDFLTKSAVL